MSAAMGVDVGGTFTDVVLVDAEGNIHVAKVVTTPSDPRDGGIQRIGTAHAADAASQVLAHVDRDERGAGCQQRGSVRRDHGRGDPESFADRVARDAEQLPPFVVRQRLEVRTRQRQALVRHAPSPAGGSFRQQVC